MDRCRGDDGATTTSWPAIAAAAFDRRPAEIDEALIDNGDQPAVGCWRPAPGALLALPEHYMPGYAYPLLIWLSDVGRSEREVGDWLQAISSRNYVALGLNSALYVGSAGQRGDRGEASQVGLERVGWMLRRVERACRLHPARRYVAGRGSLAAAAVEWALRRPQWFRGAIGFDPPPRVASSFRRTGAGHHRQRVLWMPGRTAADAAGSLADAVALRCLGLEVDLLPHPIAGDPGEHDRSASDGGERGSDAAATWLSAAERINAWIMAEIPTAVS